MGTSKKGFMVGESQRHIHVAAAHERRLSPRAMAMIEEFEKKETTTGASLLALSVNRAVSAATLAKLDDFYVTGMGTTKVSSDEANGYTRQCYLWSGAKVDVCFTNRDDSATKGSWKVGDFEDMLNTVHKNIIVGYPFCGMDKWEDNHYAIDSPSAHGSGIITYVNNNSPPHICEASMGSSSSYKLHYIFDPTGWGIQVDLSFNTEPTDCQATSGKARNYTRHLEGGHENPACEPGTCASNLQEQ